MRKAILILSLLFLVFASFPQAAGAATQACRGVQSGPNVTLPFWNENLSNNYTHTVVVDMSSYDKNQEYEFLVQNREASGRSTQTYATSAKFKIGQNGTFPDPDGSGTLTVQGNKITWIVKNEEAFMKHTTSFWDENSHTENHYLNISQNPGVGHATFCTMNYFTVTQKAIGDTCKMYIFQERGGDQCYSTGCMESGTATIIQIEDLKYGDAFGTPFDKQVKVVYNGGDDSKLATNGKVEFAANLRQGTHNISVWQDNGAQDWRSVNCFTAFSATDSCGDVCDETRADVAGQGTGITGNFRLCEQTGNNIDRQKCLDCVGGTTLGGQETGMWTAIGCIPTNAQGIIQTIVQLGLGMGGGITLLLILAGAFRLSVSQGDPKAAEEAKEQITSAVIGLLFIIFSIAMLRFIGVQVLNIPGFGTP